MSTRAKVTEEHRKLAAELDDVYGVPCLRGIVVQFIADAFAAKNAEIEALKRGMGEDLAEFYTLKDKISTLEARAEAAEEQNLRIRQTLNWSTEELLGNRIAQYSTLIDRNAALASQLKAAREALERIAQWPEGAQSAIARAALANLPADHVKE